jgi:hypothetical protein
MDEFGEITIDNKNLLNDLLELDGQHDFDDQYDLLYSNPNNNYNVNQNQFLSKQTDPLGSMSQGRKFYVESPTFAKGEDDIYR